MEKTNKSNEFAILRAIGALSVIIIHITSVYVEFNNTSFSYLSFGIVNKFCNFAVPLFLFLSILLLTKNALSKEKLNVLEFYKKRFFKVVPLYLVYIVVYYFWQKHNNITLISPTQDPLKFFTSYILQGEIFYHLYFMVIIFQLYLLFPIFYWITKKISKSKIKIHPIISFILAFTVFFLLQFAFQKINKYYIYPYYKYNSRILFSYLLPIGMGIWIGANYESFKNSKVIKILAFITASISGYFFIRYTLYPTIQLNSLVLSTYTASVCIALLSICILINKTKIIKPILDSLSKHSLTIYLIHPLILDIFNRNFSISNCNFTTNLGYATIKFIIVLGISYLVALITSYIPKPFTLTKKQRKNPL